MVIAVKAAPDLYWLYKPDWLFLSMRLRRVPSVFDFQFSSVGMLSLSHPGWFSTLYCPFSRYQGLKTWVFFQFSERLQLGRLSHIACRCTQTSVPPILPTTGSAVQLFREALRCADFPETVWDFSPHAWETFQQSEAKKKTWVISNVCKFQVYLRLRKLYHHDTFVECSNTIRCIP